MKIFITQWALDTYLDLKYRQVFLPNEYWDVIRPDVLLLNVYPNHEKFKIPKFWSVANDGLGNVIFHGFKMKWHQIGNGKVQLRLAVMVNQDAILCEAYVKGNDKEERRRLAKFKTHMQLIQQGRYTTRGILI